MKLHIAGDSQSGLAQVCPQWQGRRRYTLSSAALLDTLRQYWRTRPSQDWLFPQD